MKGRVGYIIPNNVDTRTVGSPCPIRFVIFPKYVEGVEPRLYPISHARATLMLASSALNRHVFGDRAMSIISDVMRGAECYGLQSGRIADTCELVESLVSNT